MQHLHSWFAARSSQQDPALLELQPCRGTVEQATLPSLQRLLQKAAELGVFWRKQKAAGGVVSRRSAPQLVVTHTPGPRARQHARKGSLTVRTVQCRPTIAPSILHLCSAPLETPCRGAFARTAARPSP